MECSFPFQGAKITLIIIRAALCGLAFLQFSGCSKGVEPADEARIVLRESVDGVKFGDSEQTVVQKLGQPDDIAQGDFPGVTYEYNTGKYATMHVTIYSPGVLHSGVVYISVQSPYPGATKDGIGIGSPRESVRQILGQPDSHGESVDTTWDRYEDDAHVLLVNYRGEVVESLMLGVRM